MDARRRKSREVRGERVVRVRAEHVLRERPVYAARKLYRANLPPWATRGTVIIAMGSADICARNIPHVALGVSENFPYRIFEFFSLLHHNLMYGDHIKEYVR